MEGNAIKKCPKGKILNPKKVIISISLKTTTFQ